MNFKKRLKMACWAALATFIAGSGLPAADTVVGRPAPLVLKAEDFRHYVEAFNRNDRELYVQHVPNAQAWDFLQANIPLLDCPDKELEEVYYFRWWTYRKHLKQTSDGFLITEFLPNVGWAGKHNSINCAAGHHFMEGRWLADPKYLDDYASFWLRKGGAVRTYSFWIADSLVQRAAVTGDTRLALDLLPELIANYQGWERERLDASGLFWQNDGKDGMEVSISGALAPHGAGFRATINSYQYADALAIAQLADLAGRDDVAREYRGKAAKLKRLVLEKLWDADAQFFKVLPCGKTSLSDARELHGYTPWYFNLPDAAQAVAWKQLMDPQGFYAPFGPTTAEQRHPKFAIAYQGHECQWNGPSWPFSTAITLTALANLLNNDPQTFIGKADYWKTFQCYLRSHRFRELPPAPAELKKSKDNSVPRHTWWAQDRLGRTEWVQYEFKEPVTLEATEVFWYDDDAGIDPPASWRILARDGADWREVQAKGPYGTGLDRYNRVEFKPVTATAFRLEAATAKGKSAGILEWRVCQVDKNQAGKAVPSASCSDIYAARLGALNDGARQPERQEAKQPWIDENLNPFTGDWIARTLLRQRGQKPEERGKDYNHSTFCDLVISGLVGLRPRPDDVVEVNPLIPDGTWDYFCLDQIRYHGRWLTILYDKTGQRYGKGKGLRVFCDGRETAAGEKLGLVTGRLPKTAAEKKPAEKPNMTGP